MRHGWPVEIAPQARRTLARRETGSSVEFTPDSSEFLEASCQGQDEQNQQHESERAARRVSPPSAVRPGGHRANQHQHEENNKDRDHKPLLFIDPLPPNAWCGR
jgi:hypothetical protein